MRISDWSSDVCSSDLAESPGLASAQAPLQEPRINIGRFAAMDLEEDAPQSAPLHEDAGSQEQPHHWKWYNSWPFLIVAGLLALIVLVWAILFITKGWFLKHPFESIVSANLERQVDIGGDFQLYFAPINVKLVAEDMVISNPEWATQDQFFTADRIEARIATFSLLTSNNRINWLHLINGKVNLEWEKGGKRNSWTFGDPKRTAQPLDLPIVRRALVAGTDIRYRDPQLQLVANINIDTVKARDTQFENDIRFSGSGTMRERPFTVSGGLLSPNATISGGKNQLALRAESAATILEVSGTLPGATEIEGADLTVEARGPNLRRLFDFLGVAIPDTRKYRITSRLTKAEEEWRFTRLKGTFGESDLSGRFTISMPKNRLLLDADLSSRVLDIIDAGPFIGYSPERLDREGGSGAIERVGGTPRVLPDAPLRLDAISRFDANVKYKVRRVRAESFPISNISLTLGLARSLLKLAPLTFYLSGGFFSSVIKIDRKSVV